MLQIRSIDIPEDIFFHGTILKDLPEIKQHGMRASTSGFGQSALTGVGLLDHFATAKVYAISKAKSDEFGRINFPVVIAYQTPAARWADLSGMRLPFDAYEIIGKKRGYTFESDAFYDWILRYKQWFGYPVLTTFLQEEGFDGAIIDSTLGENYPASEYIWFNPKTLKYLDVIQLKHG